MKCENCTKYKNGKCEHWGMPTKEDGYCHEYNFGNFNGVVKKDIVEAIKLLCPNHKWLAMDCSGEAYVYTIMPYYSGSSWYTFEYEYVKIPALRHYTDKASESLIDIDEFWGGHDGRN